MRKAKLVLVRRTLQLLLLFLGIAENSAAANTSTFYYSVTAEAKPTGLGTVYVNSQATESENREYKPSSTVKGSGQTLGSSTDANIYLYAKPKNDFTSIDHWERTFNGTTERIAGNIPELVQNISFDGGERNPTAYIYTAYFVEQTGLVKAVSTNTENGTASVSNPDNAAGDEITLTANPDVANGVIFLGWKTNANDEGDFISTDNPYQLTVTEAVTYYAYFSDKSTTVYCRIKNNKTGRYLSVIGDKQAGKHTASIEGSSSVDGFVFTGSLKMIDEEEAKGNPSTVFKRTGTALGTTVWENVGLSSLSAPFAIMTGSGKPLRIENIDGNYRLSEPIELSSGGKKVDARTYLRDVESSDTPTMETTFSRTSEEISNFGIDWTVYVLTEDTKEGAFGANAKEKFSKDRKYYTTMFTDFPYQLLDGVKAYYLPLDESCYDKENNVVKFMEIESGIVPAKMAVILECTNTGDVNNRLLPLTTEVAEIVPSNTTFLKGYIRLNGSTVANEKKRMWILSTRNDILGFYHYSGENMNPFKAYLELPEEVDDNPLSKTVRFAFGDDGVITDIPMSVQFTEEDDSDVYNLYGCRVTNLTRGIYVKHGRKFVVK